MWLTNSYFCLSLHMRADKIFTHQAFLLWADERIWCIYVQTSPFLPSSDRQIYRTLMNSQIYYDRSSEKGAVWGQSRIWITSMLIWSQQAERDSRAWIPIHTSWIRTRTWLLMPVRRSGKVLKCTLEGCLQASTPKVRESCFQSILTQRERKKGAKEWRL